MGLILKGESMDEILKVLTLRSKRLHWVLNVVSWFFLLLVFVDLGLMVTALCVDDALLPISSMVADRDISLRSFIENCVTTTRQVTVAKLITSIVQSLAFFFYIRLLLLKLLGEIKEGVSPFSREGARKLRTAARITFFLLWVISGILVAVIGYMTLLFFSSLFEYGAVIQDKAAETNRIQEEMIVSFAELTENKSVQTGHHVKRVSEYSRLIAEQMGLEKTKCEEIRLASTMHDIGKLLVPSEILEKPGRLTDEEFAEIKKHPGYGGELLENVEGDIMVLARTIALDHHERPDGRGYPYGKTEGDISVAGKIVAVADVYDALTSKRSYKEAWDAHTAYAEIVKNSGGQFDEKVVEAFKVAYPKIEQARQEYADGKSLTFKPDAGDKGAV